MKKKSVGIIAEYNPFHNGHLYQIEESVKATGAEVVIAAMSGNFVQRGVPAIADKWQRAEAAVRSGVDIVIEIPTVFACNSAHNFAEAGVEILENLGADFISFGSESGNIEELKGIARIIDENSEYIENFISKKTKDGWSYPRARRAAVESITGASAASLLDSPNNILAIEYIGKISNALPVTIMRTGPGYNEFETTEKFASATAIRSLINENEDISHFMPEEAKNIFFKSEPVDKDVYFRLICHKVLSADSTDMEKAPAGGEGLANKLKASIRMCSNLEELSESLKSKRYTRTRIDRFICQTLLGIDREKKTDNYIRVLGLSSNGREYIREVKKSETCRLPIITNINKDIKNFKGIGYGISVDILAADIYNIAAGKDLYRFSEYLRRPFCE